MLNDARQAILKITLSTASFCSSTWAQEGQIPASDENVAVSTLVQKVDSLNTELQVQPSYTLPIFADERLLTNQFFEAEVKYFVLTSGSDKQIFYRFNALGQQPGSDQQSEKPVLVFGPFNDQLSKTFETLLTERNFSLTETGSGNFLEGRLQLKPETPLSMPQSSWWTSELLETLGKGAFVYIFCGVTGILSGAYLVTRAKLGGRMQAQVQQFETAPDERYEDVGGCDHIVEEMREIVADIRATREGTLSYDQLIKGIIFEGDPGAGKTLLARATAGEIDCPFLYINSASITASKWAGDWTAAMLDAFKQARLARDKDQKQLDKLNQTDAQCQGMTVIFFDEFDSIGMKRNSDDSQSGATREYNDVVNALLAEMDSVDAGLNRGIIVLAATNRASIIDSALTRPGRFSRIMNVPTPSTEAQRKDIFEKLAKKLIYPRGYAFEESNPFEMIAKITVGDTGDYLRGILMEAIGIARREKVSTITTEHLVEAFQRQKFGRSHANYLSQNRKELVAYHEHGHALVALACGIDPFVVSMCPRGTTGGRVILDPGVTYQPPASLRDLLRSALINLGGRASELLYFGDRGITEGAASDIENCRSLFRRALTFGMVGGSYAENLLDPQDPLPPRLIRIVNKEFDKTLEVCRRVIEAVGKELVSWSLILFF